MTVYIDQMNVAYGRMIMCHMLADNRKELDDMANKIGLNKKWIQYPGTYKEHYDICLQYKNKALKAGAIEINRKQVALLLRSKKLA
jgi:hypothetical protein